MAIKPEKYRKYYRECSNNFAADCRPIQRINNHSVMEDVNYYAAGLNFQLTDLVSSWVTHSLQSAAKFFVHLLQYLWFFFQLFFHDLISNFYHFMLVINSIKLTDHDLTNIFCIKLLYVSVFWHELFQVLE